MPTFKLGECNLELPVEHLKGPLAGADRQVAWRLYVELVTRPALRAETISLAAVQELMGELRRLIADWPAAQIEEPKPTQLGFVVLSAIELVLLPCLEVGGESMEGWKALREFCQSLATELAETYDFCAPSGVLPADLRAAWARP